MSSQYLQNCRDNNADCGGAQLGQVLTINPAYFRQACDAIFEVAVKLSHVLWRKLRPADIAGADSHLVTTSYHLLVEQRYELAKAILDFATKVLKKHSSNEARLLFVINRVQAYKWSGDEAQARAVLDMEDFSALSDTFKLANAVLRDNFAVALDLVKRIGNSGGMSIGAYREWPLFRELRKQAAFEPIVTEVFGESLNVNVQAPEGGLSAGLGWDVPAS